MGASMIMVAINILVTILNMLSPGMSLMKMPMFSLTFFFNDTPPTEIYTLSLHDALPISGLDASIAAPGPHGFLSADCRSSACKHAAATGDHRLPASRVVTIAIRPSWRSRMDGVEHNFWKNERTILSREAD